MLAMIMVARKFHCKFTIFCQQVPLYIYYFPFIINYYIFGDRHSETADILFGLEMLYQDTHDLIFNGHEAEAP